MDDRRAQLRDNLAAVQERMAAAAREAGRQLSDIKLVAVTKYAELDDVRLLWELGVRDFGESRPQQLVERAEQLADLSLQWHLIGHWQRNKIRRTLPHVFLLHAGDSWRLLETVDAEARRAGRSLAVLLEVNISGDATKHGFAPEELEPLLPRLAELSGLRIQGLMAMSGRESDERTTRREFAAVRELAERLRRVSPPQWNWQELSLGMSDDFEWGIAAGATCVRIGSLLFQGASP